MRYYCADSPLKCEQKGRKQQEGGQNGHRVPIRAAPPDSSSDACQHRNGDRSANLCQDDGAIRLEASENERTRREGGRSQRHNAGHKKITLCCAGHNS